MSTPRSLCKTQCGSFQCHVAVPEQSQRTPGQSLKVCRDKSRDRETAAQENTWQGVRIRCTVCVQAFSIDACKKIKKYRFKELDCFQFSCISYHRGRINCHSTSSSFQHQVGKSNELGFIFYRFHAPLYRPHRPQGIFFFLNLIAKNSQKCIIKMCDIITIKQ